jgi:hypothetical protein
MTEIDYASRVAKGVALMDKRWPNWAAEIDLETLDISRGECCVTAQYHMSTQALEDRDPDDNYNWVRGRRQLGLDDSDYSDHGFNGAEWPTGNPVPEATYAALNGLWRAEIERRRAQGQDAPAEPEASER